MSSEKYNSFIEKQDEIYNKFRVATENLGVTQGTERDPGVDPQGAFLVAWRFPDQLTASVEEFSLEVRDIINAIPYGRESAHTTVSDFGLAPNLVVNPAQKEEGEVLDTLAKSVKKALEITSDQEIGACGVEFTENLHNGKTMIAAGIPTETVWQINQQVLAQSHELGIPLKGTWGGHMTTSRSLERHPTDSPQVNDLVKLMKDSSAFGQTKPVAIDVGYFRMSPDEGFTFHTYERFELG